MGRETYANAPTMQTSWVGVGSSRAAPCTWHGTHSTDAALCVLAGKAGSSCPYHAAAALAKQPLMQLILAACVAVAAGAAAWYLM